MRAYSTDRAPVAAITRWAARAALAVLLMPAPAPAALAGPDTRFPAQEQPPKLQPVQIVVLVDESGSLAADGVDREREAASVIALGQPASDSTVSVVGFASADADDRSPVDKVCPPTKLDTPANRQFLADCVGRLHVRTQDEGDGTDHVSALRQALSYLSGPGAGGQPKIVFLLTDGVLDVSHSPLYGRDADAKSRNDAATAQVPGVLDQLRAAGVQVWPLGYGREAVQEKLDQFATGGAQDGCGLRTPKPSAKVINSIADLQPAIGAALSAALCTSVSAYAPGTLPPGGSVDLQVDVPAIATEGSILVIKHDPHVTVGYLDPQATPVPTNGDLGSSHFELSGQNTGVEALRIVNPTPGTWTVRVSSAPGGQGQEVAVTAIFQRAVTPGIDVVPPVPVPGSQVEVTMQVLGARAPITDPAQLRGLTFATELRGDGFAPRPPLELADPDGDGRHQGRVTVPATATGTLDFVGTVTGAGVSRAEKHVLTRIATPPTFVGRFWWVLLLLAVALAGAAALVARAVRQRRRARDVHGVQVELRRHGQELDTIIARRHSDELRFGVRRDQDSTPSGLTPAAGGGDRYRVRRGGAGLIVTGPSGAPVTLAPGGVLELGEGHDLVFADRPAGTDRRPPPGPRSSEPPRPTYTDNPY